MGDDMVTAKDKVKEDMLYWQELADLVGWKLTGFSFRNTASYTTSGSNPDNRGLQITGPQRDDIVSAIKRAGAPQW
jgi:hypothetical protein